jgi:hypothetical protein
MKGLVARHFTPRPRAGWKNRLKHFLPTRAAVAKRRHGFPGSFHRAEFD